MKHPTIYTAALAALMLIPASCSDEQYTAALAPGQQPGNGASGPLITVTATQGARPQTRLGYDVPSDPTQPIEVTWAATDHFYIGKDFSAFTSETPLSLSAATTYFSPLTIKEGDAGKKNAEFTGNLPTSIPNDDPLYAIYGDGTTRIALNGAQQGAQQGTEQQGTLSFDYTNQRQTANNDKTHLSAADFMVATTTYKTGEQPVFAFTHLGAMMKFTLTLPTEGLTVKELTLTTTNDTKPFSDVAQWDKAGTLAFSKTKTASASTTLLLGQEETGITLTGTKILTAYIMVAPTTLTKESASMTRKTLKLQVTDADDVVYIANFKGADIEQGKYYTVEAVMKAYDEMSFTIRIDSEIEGNWDFNIPFQNQHTFTAKTTVNWGDGQTTVVEADEQIRDLSHTYATTGDYIITISSAQSDATQQQIPKIYFERDNLNRENAAKIISLNTPMLNMGTSLWGCLYKCVNLVSLPGDLLKKNTLATDFYKCFYGCEKLQELPADLFKENTQATDFQECFLGCTSLKALPADLFKENTQATSFEACFLGCTSLKELPADLFKENTQATHFEGCFLGCTSLKELPAGLFDNNKLVKTFYQCFNMCTALVTLPVGLFDNNTPVRDFDDCFKGCTSLKELPAGLFDKNTEASLFRSCFEGCTNLASLPEGLFHHNTNVSDYVACFKDCSNLVLNEKIFCSAENSDERNSHFSEYRNLDLSFKECFYNAGSALTDEQKATSVAPELWNCEWKAGDNKLTKTDCFKGCKASNLADKSSSWEWGAPAN